MNEQERLYAIRVLENTPDELAQLKAQHLKRESSITFKDEDERLGRTGRWMSMDVTLEDHFESLK